MMLLQSLSPRHKAAARSLCYALSADDPSAWEAACLIWQARLLPDERAAAALAFLTACEADHAAAIIEALEAKAGPPRAPLFDLAGEAVLWAEVASVAELKSYIMAAWAALGPVDQLAFLDKIAGRRAA